MNEKALESFMGLCNSMIIPVKESTLPKSSDRNCINCEPRNDCKSVVTKYGYCCYCKNGIEYLIFNLYVYKHARRKGHARDILAKCIKEINKIGYKDEILIKAEPKENSISRNELIRFYESMGLKLLM